MQITWVSAHNTSVSATECQQEISANLSPTPHIPAQKPPLLSWTLRSGAQSPADIYAPKITILQSKSNHLTAFQLPAKFHLSTKAPHPGADGLQPHAWNPHKIFDRFPALSLPSCQSANASDGPTLKAVSGHVPDTDSGPCSVHSLHSVSDDNPDTGILPTPSPVPYRLEGFHSLPSNLRHSQHC